MKALGRFPLRRRPNWYRHCTETSGKAGTGGTNIATGEREPDGLAQNGGDSMSMRSLVVKKLSSAGGFSSIEVLSSMFVFAVVSLGVASSTVTAVQTNRASQQKAVAVNLAHQALECMKSQIHAGRSLTAANAGGDCNPAGAPAGYTLTVPAATAGTGAYAGMTRVQITISWRSPKPDFVLLDSYLDT
jgi:hypothetical protein